MNDARPIEAMQKQVMLC